MCSSDLTPLLELQGIRKQFAGVTVLDGISLRLFPGEIHALMGENGAGKSTLIKVLTGVLASNGGQMWLQGQPVAPATPLPWVAEATLTALAELPDLPVPAAPATPDAFTYQDMISANRLGDPQVSPDGRYVVYSVTTTDVEANRRSGSLWILDLETPDAAPRRLAISDQAANTARWGADGNLYFLSGKSGTSQVWRIASPTAAPVQVTNLPLDVNAYRISPSGDKVAVSLAVYPDAADLNASVEMGKAVAERKSTGQVYDRMFVRHWDTWNDHTQNHLFVQSIGRNGQATGNPVWVTKGFDGDTPSKPFGDESDFTFAPDRKSTRLNSSHTDISRMPSYA